MSDIKKRYKNPPSTFGNARKIKVNIAHEQQERRKKRRTQEFEENRKENIPRSVSQNDKIKFSNWKAEQERKKKTKPQKKPPFIVGIVRHSFYSPISNTAFEPTKKKKSIGQEQKNSNIKKRITKATEKRLLAKATSATKETCATSSGEKIRTDKIKSDVKKRKSFAPSNHKFNPPAGLSKITLSQEMLIEDNSSNKNDIFACDKSAENITTIIKKSVNCDSDSIEAITLKVSIGEQEILNISPIRQINSMERSTLNNSNTENPFESLSTSNKLAIKDIVTDNSDMIKGEEEYTVKYFEHMLNNEKDRLQKLCKKWSEIQSRHDTAEDVRYRINQAVGQTVMLIKEKFKQFHGLIQDCISKNNDILITCTDLHGFWDMMYIEVKDCDLRFAKLEELQAKNWQEDQSFFAKPTKSKKKIIVEEKVTDKAVKQSSRKLTSNKKKTKKKTKEIIEIQDNKIDSQCTINMNDKYITPCKNNEKIINVHKDNYNNNNNNNNILEVSMNYIYTSTPFPDTTSNLSNRMSTPLITMKVSQLYNKFTQSNDMTLYTTPEFTNSQIEKSEKRRRKLEFQANSNDYLPLIKSVEKLEIDKNLSVSKEINNFKCDNLNSNDICIIQQSNSTADDFSGETVIEQTRRKDDVTLKSTFNTGSIKTPVESKSKTAIKGPSSSEICKTRSLSMLSTDSIKTPVQVKSKSSIKEFLSSKICKTKSLSTKSLSIGSIKTPVQAKNKHFIKASLSSKVSKTEGTLKKLNCK